ncbi:16795_t:CDS:2, partial [Gigaspora margarita]
DNSLPTKKRVVLIYDSELRKALLEKFYIGNAHFEYHKTYTMIYERHIVPVVSDGPLEHLQVDLVDLLSYAEHNDEYSYILILIDVFSHYAWAIPLKDKEGSTIHSELLVHSCTRHPQSQGKIEKFNQTLGQHLTKMMWDEVSGVQAPYEAHKKSPYEAFFEFKICAVYNILEDITLEDVATEDVTPENIAPEDIALENIIVPEDITEEFTPAATQDNYNQASYEFHAMQ